MPKMDVLPSRLQSSALVSPLSSPASSLPCVYSPGLTVATRTEKIISQQRKKTCQWKSNKHQQATYEDEDPNSCDTTNLLQDSGCLLTGQSDDKDPQPSQAIADSNGDDKSSWPVLVAVRCRPRKCQRIKGRFAAVLDVDEEIRRPGLLDSSDSSDVSSSSDERESNYRSSSDSVQRGVFEYSACRDYDYAATYDAKIPPPRIQRPRRLYVQAPAHTTGNISGRRSFDFDFIFPPWKKQRDVYDKCVQAQICHVLQAQQQRQMQHATIVAYGQTGTGKTYTMGMLSDFTDKEQGLIPRALSQVLDFTDTVEGEADARKPVVTLSFLQIYLETVQDLLALPRTTSSAAPENPWRKRDTGRHCRSSSSDLPVRQGRDGAFYVADLNEYEISSIEDAHALLELAMRNRVLAATSKNKTSSRSHTLLTISIKRRRRGTRSKSKYSYSEDEGDKHDEDTSVDEDELKQASTISFVDLAGSERVDGALHFLRATRARQEQRIREAKFINRSLSALGGVIAALAQPKSSATGRAANLVSRLNVCLHDKLQHPVGNDQGQPHIRFRDSQLTKLLQGRLMGGCGRLLLIATVDDQAKNLSETLSTLKFASQCRRVELQARARLRGDRDNRLRRQKSLLDQVFNDMKMMHENREAALHSEYHAQIEALEHELETVRAAALSSSCSKPDDIAPVHLASYMALCSLVDTVCFTEHSTHPSVVEFQSEKQMLEYVAGLYSRLKKALATPHLPVHSSQTTLEDTTDPVAITKTSSETTSQLSSEKVYKQAVLREPVRATTLPAAEPSNSNTSRSRSRIQLSPDRETEFRAVARHLITSRALESFIVSSSDEDA